MTTHKRKLEATEISEQEGPAEKKLDVESKEKATEAEVWKRCVDRKGVEFPIEASSRGRVRNAQTGRVFVITRDLDGRGMVKFIDASGRRIGRLVSTLVCSAFNGVAPSEKHQVRHIDGDPTNDTPGNLEWATQSTIGRHAKREGRCSKRVCEQDAEDVALSRDAKEEQWASLSCAGFRDYEVSTKGRVRNSTTDKVLTPVCNCYGYMTVNLLSDTKTQKTQFAHVLVAKAFLPQPDTPSWQTDHRNGDRKDNRLENLRIVSRSENMTFAVGRAIIRESKDGVEKQFPSIRAAARELGGEEGMIAAVSAIRRAAKSGKSVRGYRWRYVPATEKDKKQGKEHA